MPYAYQPAAQMTGIPAKAGLRMSLLCTYVFLIYSRAPEVIGSYVGSLHLAMILMAILICFFFLSAWPSKPFFSLPGMAHSPSLAGCCAVFP